MYFYVYFLFSKRTQTLVMLAHRVKSIGRCITKKESWIIADNDRKGLPQQNKRTSAIKHSFSFNPGVVKHSFSFNQRRRYAVALFRNHRFI